MEVTKLIVEYLVSGVLMMLALLLLAFALSPIDLKEVLQLLGKAKDLFSSIELIVAFSFTAIAYALGIVVEYVGTLYSTKVLDWIKIKRLKRYIELNTELFAGDPLLKQFVLDSSAGAASERLSRVVGEMRYYVMAKDQALYADIAQQINRLRLIRATLIFGLLVSISLLIFLFRSYSAGLLYALVLSIGLTVASLGAVLSRLHRYCRCVEKAYKTLALARSETTDDEAQG